MGLIILYILTVFSDIIICTQIDSKIYLQINKYQPCVQLANATHQIGCTSAEKGNRGTIHIINSEEDIDWLIKEGPYPPYVPLFDAPMFSEKSMKKLIDSKKIDGALVILRNSSMNTSSIVQPFFSPDPICPMDDFGVYNGDKKYGGCKKVKWNADGNGMSMIYYGIPIFSISDSEEIRKITECVKKYNYDENRKAKGYPVCAVEMKDFMFSAKDTPTCMRKSETSNPIMNTYCDPLGDENVFGTLYPLVEELKEDDIIMASTKIDSTAFFHDIAPGGDNGITGIVTLLTVAYTLGEYKRSMLNKSIVENLKPIVFTFFNGEVWDYIGSSRMVWDMEKGKFPYPGKNQHMYNGSIDDSTSVSKINTTHIGYFMEISQVGLDPHGTVFAHSDPISQGIKKVSNKVDTMIKALEKGASISGTPFRVVNRTEKHPLPPASFQRFLRSRSSIAGVVLADHENEFVNKFYNSRFDNGENLGIGINNRTKKIHGSLPSNLTILSEAIANALYYLASNGSKPKEKLTVPQNLTADLLKCFLYTANCSAFREIDDGKTQFALPINAYQRYISISNGDTNPITYIIHRLLMYYTGEWLVNCSGKTPTKLPKALSYFRVEGKGTPKCVKGTAYRTKALSPAFELKDYASTEYSTWTESMWSADMGIRMYLVANPQLEGALLGCGLVMLILSFCIVYFMRKKASILFTPVITIVPSVSILETN